MGSNTARVPANHVIVAPSVFEQKLPTRIEDRKTRSSWATCAIVLSIPEYQIESKGLLTWVEIYCAQASVGRVSLRKS